MEKEIKVFQYRDMNDNYVELWKVIDENKYYGRYMYHNEGTWYYVADPLGYCELDHSVSDDVTFIICDEKGKEYYRYSNGQPNPLPTRINFIKATWCKVKDNIIHNTEDDELNFWSMCLRGETTRKLEKWIISFKDPDLYGEKAKDYEENWYGCWQNTETEYTVIPGSQFEFLGQKLQFVKVHHKHDICGIEWDTFECCDNPIQMSVFGTKTHPLIEAYIEVANWFDDSKYGTMMDKSSARTKVIKALESNFPRENDYQKLLLVSPKTNDSFYSTDTCSQLTYGQCAEHLIDRDYHINNIQNLVDNIEQKTNNLIFISNMENKEKIKEMYPDIYGYDWCLI